MISKEAKKLLFNKSGGRCAFPGCDSHLSQSGIFVGDICHIHALAPGGSRYDQRKTIDDISKEENLIILCPNHHRLVSPFGVRLKTEIQGPL